MSPTSRRLGHISSWCMNSSWSSWWALTFQVRRWQGLSVLNSWSSTWSYSTQKIQGRGIISRPSCIGYMAGLCLWDHISDKKCRIWYFISPMRRRSIMDWLSCWRFLVLLLMGTLCHWKRNIECSPVKFWSLFTKLEVSKLSILSSWHAWKISWKKIKPSELIW